MISAVNEALYEKFCRKLLVTTLAFMGLNAQSYILLAMSKKTLGIDGRFRVREFNLLKFIGIFTLHQV